MTLVALTLVLAAALCHASWNLLLKRSGAGGPAFVWLFLALATLLYAPVAAVVVILEHPSLGPAQLLFMAGSGALHLGYFLLLQRGYRQGDLSLVYPLARGTGPALSTVAAIAIFGERPTPLALAGAALIVTGVVVLSRPSSACAERGSTPERSLMVSYALLTGAFIAAYTLWDKHAVASLTIPPVLLDWTSNLFRTALLGGFMLSRWGEVRTCWKRWRREAVAVAVLSRLAYILVLTALVTTPVSYIAPAREVSIAIGALLGIRLLREQDARRRLLAAAIIIGGVIALAFG